MHRRINITLPEETVRLIDRVATKGNRSHLIAEAIKYYIEETGRTQLRKRLREGARCRAERDLRLTQEWFFMEEEAWEHRQK